MAKKADRINVAETYNAGYMRGVIEGRERAIREIRELLGVDELSILKLIHQVVKDEIDDHKSTFHSERE